MKFRIAIIAASLASPALAQAPYDFYSGALGATPTVITSPEAGKRSVVTAGESILSQRNGRITDGAVLDAAFISPPKIANAFQATQGSEFFPVASKAALKVCGVELGAQGWPPCFLDDDGDGRFDRVASNDMRKAYPLATPVPYHRARVMLPPAVSGFTRSILYQGASSDGLRLSYREFKDNLARPAFEESMTIPLTAEYPQKVAVKGAVLTIYNIDGMGMDYQVDDPGSFSIAP